MQVSSYFTKSESFTAIFKILKCYLDITASFESFDQFYNFFLSGFSIRDTNDSRVAGEGRGRSLFLSTTSTRSRTFRHLFAPLHVEWLLRIFNRTVFYYQTASQWDLHLL